MVNPIPTLFIGIGGIGCQIAATISDMLDEASREYVGFIGIDTDSGAIQKRVEENHNMSFIQTSEKWNVENFLKKYPEHEEWFPTEKKLRKRKMLKGAGQVRALSRLTFIAAQQRGKFDLISDEIMRICKVDKNPNTRLVVVVVGSITGGTGAGMFIQLPLLIRNEILGKCGVRDCTIRGMFIGPDITETVQKKPFMKQNVRVNGYSCIKELNAFYLHHIDRDDLPDIVKNSLKIENYDSNDDSHENVPYEYLYLFETNGDAGTIGTTGLANIIKYVSHIAYNLMFTPLVHESTSIEDNFILSSLQQDMMDRYVGAGVCRAIFPIDLARNYVTYSLINDQIANDWLLLDKRFAILNDNALKLQDKDPTVVIPELSKVYVEQFEKESINEESGVGLLTKYANEAWSFQDNDHISKSALFISKIEECIEGLVESKEVTDAINACNVNKKSMKKFEKADDTVNSFLTALTKLVSLVQRLKSEMPIKYAEEFFPSDYNMMLDAREKPNCIYSLLANVHPIVARFFIYDLINRLKEMNQTSRDSLESNNLFSYRDADYDRKTKGKQTATVALAGIINNYNKFWGKLGFFSDLLYSEEDALKKLKEQMTRVSTTHTTNAKDYLRDSVTVSLSNLLLERLIALSEMYEQFFQTIEGNLATNADKLNDYIRYEMPFGTMGVFCSDKAYEYMANEFKKKKSNALVLSSTTKNAIFERLYEIQAENERDLSEGILSYVDELNEENEELRDKLNSVFRDAVESTVHAFVVQNGNSIVNYSVKEALEKEYQLFGKKNKTEDNKPISLERYITIRTKEALKKASPMLSTKEDVPREELVFISLSKTNAISPEGAVDEESTLKYYLGEKVGVHNADEDNVKLIVNNDLSAYEVVFVKIDYGHVIEHLEKYSAGSDYEKAYKARISTLISGTVLHPEYEVNPHLDRHWHEEGYIPSLLSEQREQDKKDFVKAFIYGLGFNCFTKLQFGDEVSLNKRKALKWAFTEDDSLPVFITKDGEVIGNEFADLYKALLFNGSIKKSVLSFAKMQIKNSKGYNSTELLEKNLFKNEFFIDLIHADKKTRKGAELNILDILLKMYPYLKPQEVINLVDGIRIVIWEILEKYFDNNELMINRNTKKILKAIFDNSSLASVKNPTQSEDTLIRLIEKQMKIKYTNKKGE